MIGGGTLDDSEDNTEVGQAHGIRGTKTASPKGVVIITERVAVGSVGGNIAIQLGRHRAEANAQLSDIAQIHVVLTLVVEQNDNWRGYLLARSARQSASGIGFRLP